MQKNKKCIVCIIKFVVVENNLQNLVKMENQVNNTDFELPAELDSLLDGIEVSEKLQTRDYKSLRDEMYASRFE